MERFADFVAKKSEPEKKSIMQAFKELVAHIVDTIKKALSRGNLTQYQKEYLEMEKEQAEHIRTLFLDSLDKASENYKSEQKNNTVNNGAKYSYAGENAKGSNKVSLSYAKTLENQGVDSEKIRQQTGWFKGYDGKWKFEINDKDMKLNKQGLYSRNPDIRRFVELEQKAYFYGTATTSEVDELQKLSENLKGVKITPNRLGDIIVHPKLFEAYPQLADYKITFIGTSSNDSQLGSYANNEIQLNRFLSGDKLKSSLIHEIQHAIQHIEDFETGTNPIIAGSYENYKNNAGEIEARDVSIRVNYTDEQRKNIRPDIDRENVRFYTDDILPYENIKNCDIKKTTDNRSVVVIKEDILKDVNKKNWVNVVKKNIKNKFTSGIPISGKFVKVNIISRNELTNSKYTKYLRSSDGTIYVDKLKSTNNLDEIIIASTNYINEDLNHKRKDNIVQFARGSVLIEIGNNQYSASVIIGYTSSNEMLLYDIVDFVRTKFKIKEEDTSIAMQQNAGSYRNEVSSKNIISKSNENVKNSFTVDSDGNTLSEQQQEYFKDSKVRDENGNLLVVYHGTSEDFTVFDREKGRSNMDIQGSFFSPWELDARGYGANVRAFYLNITNPASEALAYKALRKFQGQNNAGLNAREYLESLGYDGVNNGNEEYIAFYSNQIKNVDNINPTDNDDIRYSKDVDNINDLKRENKKLKEANELLRHEFELTGGLETSLSSATNIGRHIKDRYNSSLSGAEIGRDIKAMCDRVMQDEYRSYDTLYNEAKAIAKKIVDNKKKEIPAENQAVIDDIRSTAVKLSESQKKEVAYYYGSYGNFRRSNLKNINISNDGIPLDIRYKELQEAYPGLFAETSEPDEPIAIVEIVDTLKNSVENDYGYDADEMTALVTNDIIEAYFNVGTHKTFADKKQREINLIRFQYNNKIQKIKEQKKKDYQKALKDVADLKEQVRNLKQEHSRALIEMRKAEREKIRDTRERAETRESIRRCLLKLATLSKQTKKKHIPDNMIEAIKELINAVTFDTQTDVVLSERIKNLDDSFRNPKDENDIAENRADLDEHSNYAYITQLYNDYVLDEITSLQNSIGNKVLRDIELKDLKKIDELIRMTLAKINHMNNMYGYERSKSIEGSANTVIKEIENLNHKNVDVSDSKHKLIRETTKMKSSLKYGSMKPEYFFEYLGSDELLERYKEVRKGEDTWAVTINDAKKSANEIREKYGWKDWDFKKEFEYTTLYGEDIKLNLGYIMGMYAMNLRQQTRQHLLEGGFEFKAKNKEESKDKENYKVTEHDVRKITDNLTLEQKEYVQDMIGYLSNEMAEKGNEVSRQLYDVELFKESVYYPAHVDEKYLNKSSKEFKGTKKIINSGMTNATIENAISPIYLEDFDEVWAGHVDEMAKYNAFAVPLENFDRVYNFVTKDGNEYTSVEQNIEKYFGSKATKYINDLLEDLNGGVVREAGSDIADKLTSLFKKNAVFASTSVVVQQPSAIGRALCMIDSKYFAKTTITKRDYEELKKYAPVAIIKEMGYFDTNMAQSTVDYLNNPEYTGPKEKIKAVFADSAYRDDRMSHFASKADELTWCHIWNACKAEASEKYNNLTKEEQLQKAGEKFTDVITKTQVYDSVFSRSALMRSKNPFAKGVTAFMAEPTTSLNMFVNSVIQAKRGKISKAQAGKVFGSLMAASILNALLQTLVTAGRDDDKDKKYGEKYIAQLLQNFIDNANPLNQIAFVKDIIAVFFLFLYKWDLKRGSKNGARRENIFGRNLRWRFR